MNSPWNKWKRRSPQLPPLQPNASNDSVGPPQACQFFGVRNIAWKRFLGIVAVIAFSCAPNVERKAFKEYQRRYLQMQEGYCSPDVTVAERSVAEFRDWICQGRHTGKPTFNFQLNLAQANGRLFLICEFLGQTNRAEAFYQQSLQAYGGFFTNGTNLEPRMTMADLRHRLKLQERGLNVAWRQTTTAR